MDNQQTTEQQVNKYKIFRYEDRNYSVVYLYDDIDEPKYIPEIIEIPITNGSKDFFNWVDYATRENKTNN